MFFFSNFQQILNNLKKEKVVIANIFPKLQNLKDFVRQHSKKRTFRSSFESQHVKGSQTLVRSASENFSFILSSLWGDMIWKPSLLVKFEILGVFVNTLTADAKYPVWEARISSSLFKCNYVKNENFFLLFFPLMESTSNFKHFGKKRGSLQLMYFRYYRLSKIWLDHSLNSAVSEHPFTVNMLKCPKHLWNLHERTFIKFCITL